ncbi:MAG: GNAT family N-acetyltransferase [Thermoplasmata archaeon]
MTAKTPGSPDRPGQGGVLVRELRWSDFDPLRELYYLLYEERETNPSIGITLHGSRPSLADEVAWFQGMYRAALTGSTVVSVAERNGLVVGSCAVNRVGTSPTSESAHVGELGILVHRDHRGQGVGTALLEHSLRQCRGKFEVVQLSVFSVNAGARRLYERLGFRYLGTRPRHVRRGDRYYDEDLLTLDLPRASDSP